MADLGKHDGKLGIIMTVSMDYFVQGFLSGLNHRHHYRQVDNLWEDFIGDTILKHVGLNNYSQFMSNRFYVCSSPVKSRQYVHRHCKQCTCCTNRVAAGLKGMGYQ